MTALNWMLSFVSRDALIFIQDRHISSQISSENLMPLNKFPINTDKVFFRDFLFVSPSPNALPLRG